METLCFLIVGLSSAVNLALVVRVFRARPARDTPPPMPPGPVSVIMPAYNESEGIQAAVRSVAGGDHPHGIEVVVVDDGSTDGTADLVDALGLPNVRVVRPPHRGYVASVNAGIAWARHDLIVVIDDTILEPDTIQLMTGHFADRCVGAVAAHVKVGNRNAAVSRLLHLEYETRHNPVRRSRWGRAYAGSPGAVAYRRRALLEIGGLSDDTFRPDVDAFITLERDGWRVVWEPRAHAWTEASSSLMHLYRQRWRITSATILRVGKHLRAPTSWPMRAALVGQVAVPLLAPIADLPILVAVLTGNASLALGWAVTLAGHVCAAVVALAATRERMGPALFAPPQVILLRYLNAGLTIRHLRAALRARRRGWPPVHAALSGPWLP